MNVITNVRRPISNKVLALRNHITINKASFAGLETLSGTITTSSTNTASKLDSLLVVHNFSSQPQTFMIFPGAPSFIGLENPTTFTSVYQSSLEIAATSGSCTFIIKNHAADDSQPVKRAVYVVTGRTEQEMKSKLILYPNDATLLSISEGGGGSSEASSCMMTMPEGRAPSFVKAGYKGIKMSMPQSDVPDGYIRVMVDSSFSVPNAGFPFVGFGMLDPHNKDSVIPVLTWPAIPGTITTAQPSMTWCCAREKDVNAGQIFEFKSWSIVGQANFSTLNIKQTFHYTNNVTVTSAN